LAAEGSLATKLASEDSIEKARAIAAEGSLATKLASEDSIEKARAIAAEGAISGSLVAEVSNRVADVNAEETRALAAEGVLDGKINTEKGRVDAILLASDADKDSFAEIVTLINSVDATNDQAFAGYVTSNNAALSTEVSNRVADVNAEESRAIVAEGSLATKLASEDSIEKARAIAAEGSLATKLASEDSIEKARAIAAEGVLTSALSTEVVNRVADVDAEETRALAAESALDGKISSEKSIAAVEVSTEKARAIAAEGVLTSALSTEVVNRVADVDAEEARAIAAEGVLTSALSAEVSNRIAGDLGLDNKIADVLSNTDITKIDSFTEVVSSMDKLTGIDGNLIDYIKAVMPTMAINVEITATEAAVGYAFANPTYAGTELVHLNGLMQVEGQDYMLNAGGDIEFYDAPRAGSRFSVYGVLKTAEAASLPNPTY